MNIIDTHLHLENTFSNPTQALAALNKELKKINVTKFFLIHMDDTRWNYIEFANACKKFDNIISVININPNEKNHYIKFKNAHRKYNFKILKLHPRLYNFKLNSKKIYRIINYCEKNNIPVLIDAFPDGISIYKKIEPIDYFILAKKYTKVKFIWAHMGGYQVLKFMLLAKRLDNVYFDFSYSLLYFRNSSIEKDFFYSFSSLKFNNIFYGSDFPDRTINLTNKLLIKLLNKYKVSILNRKKLMYLNADKFIKDAKL